MPDNRRVCALKTGMEDQKKERSLLRRLFTVYKLNGIALGIPENEWNLKLKATSANEKAENWKCQLRKKKKKKCVKADQHSRS